jgi:hypothetical protein
MSSRNAVLIEIKSGSTGWALGHFCGAWPNASADRSIDSTSIVAEGPEWKGEPPVLPAGCRTPAGAAFRPVRDPNELKLHL